MRILGQMWDGAPAESPRRARLPGPPLPASSGSGFQTSALRFCGINLHSGQTRAEAEVGEEREWE